MNSIVRTTNQGFFSKLFHSFVGVLIGLICVPGSIVLIGWNEFRTVHRTKGLLEAEHDVVQLASPESIDATKQGNLVCTSGQATTEETLQDPEFPISGNVLRLRRDVEMYQWVEKKDRKTRKKLGGGEETVTTYTYSMSWKSKRENSESFEEPKDHTNPQLRFTAKETEVGRATLGAFLLRPEQIHQINNWKEVPLDDSVLSKLESKDKSNFLLRGGYLYNSVGTPDPDHPVIGDLRIRFEWVEPTTVSVLGKQEDARISVYKTSNGESIDALMLGNQSAQEMVDDLKRQNTTIAMLLRLAGWILSIVGFALITSPLKALADFVPFLGSLVGTATFIIALILGSCTTLASISVAWIAVRPLYSIALIAIIGVGLYFLFFRKRKTQMQDLPVATPI